MTLAIPNAHHAGPELTQFEKANAIDSLIGIGYACKRLDADTRGRLYDELGNIEEMSWYWETLLNKFTSPEITGVPPVVCPPGGRPTHYRCSRLAKEQHLQNQAAPTNPDRVYTAEGAEFRLEGDETLFRAAHMANALFRSESRAF